MFDATIENIETDRVAKYRLTRDSSPLSYSDVLDLWVMDTGFRDFFSRLLADSPFVAYRWETAPLVQNTAANPFEFVLLNCPEFCSRPPDARTYHDYFTLDDTNEGIVSFANLRGDATLIVPSPRTGNDAYGHLAAFIRSGPKSQLDAFWRVVGTTVKSAIQDKPIWVSTAGGGVAWLHVRLDSRPKYYGHASYRRTA